MESIHLDEEGGEKQNENPIFWTDLMEMKLFQLILKYCLDSMNSILLDIQFLLGEKPRRTSSSSDVPDLGFQRRRSFQNIYLELIENLV